MDRRIGGPSFVFFFRFEAARYIFTSGYPKDAHHTYDGRIDGYYSGLDLLQNDADDGHDDDGDIQLVPSVKYNQSSRLDCFIAVISYNTEYILDIEWIITGFKWNLKEYTSTS